MRLKLGDLIGLLALAAGAFFFFATHVWRDMPPALSFGGMWVSACVFGLAFAWHLLPNAAHRHVLDNSPWYTVFGLLLTVIVGMGLYQLQEVPPTLFPAKPSVLLLWENEELRIYNRWNKDILLWGDKLGNNSASMESVPRIIPVNGFYYLLSDRFRAIEELALGPNGRELVPFEVYIEDNMKKKYTAKFGLLVFVSNWVMTSVHTQQFGVSDGG